MAIVFSKPRYAQKKRDNAVSSPLASVRNQIGFEDLSYSSQQHLLDLVAVYTALTEAQTSNLSVVNTDHADNNTSVDYNDNYSSISDNITVIGDNDYDDDRVIENITSLSSMTSSDKSAVRPDLLVPVHQHMTYHIAMEAKEPEKPAEISADLSIAYEEIPPPSRTPSPITPTCAASPLRSRNQQQLTSNLPDLVLDVNQSALTTTAPCLPDVVPQQKTPRKNSTSSPQRRGSFRIVSKELAQHQSTPKNSPNNDSIDEGYHSQAKRLRSNENSPATEPRQSPQTKDNTVARPRGAQRKLQFQTAQQEPGNLQVLDTWKNIGYQLNRISTNFAARNRLQNNNTDHVDITGPMSLITRGYTMITNNSSPPTNENEVDTMSHAQQPSSGGRKYMAELAVSVVTNAIVFICVRKLQKIIF